MYVVTFIAVSAKTFPRTWKGSLHQSRFLLMLIVLSTYAVLRYRRSLESQSGHTNGSMQDATIVENNTRHNVLTSHVTDRY